VRFGFVAVPVGCRKDLKRKRTFFFERTENRRIFASSIRNKTTTEQVKSCFERKLNGESRKRIAKAL